MSRHRRRMPVLRAWAIGVTSIAGLVANNASAQYYCDERYQSCPGYRQPSPPPPQPIFPFGLFQPREAAPPPEPAPYGPPTQAAPSAPARPGYAAQPIDPGLGRQYASLYAPVAGEPYPIPGVRLSDIDPEYLRKAVYFPSNEPPGTIIVDAQNRF